ncbi:MAG: DUF3987 domain-containing protein [Deltaproteobacteria bacterium]|nr:DUF3987 domain-containing protein [Deltaproteobacteria bacterium]
MESENEHPAVIFSKPLYQYCNGGFIHVLLIDRAKNTINKFIFVEKLDSIPSLLKAYRGYNVYFGVATRLDGDMTKEGIIEIPVLWVEIDLTDKFGVDLPNKKEIIQRLKDFPLKPTFIINSGGGLHVYWKLKNPLSKNDIILAENLLKKLAFYLGGDRSSTDASRNLRLPGTWNLKPKYKTPRKVTVEEAHPENEYNPGDFDFLPEIEEPSPPNNEDRREYHQEKNERLIMECEFLKHCDKDRATLSEPEWYAMISILAREIGGPNLIHNLSRGYPKYSPAETNKKILHAINDAGPATCERIKSLWDCKKNCGVKSPAVLALKTKRDESAESYDTDIRVIADDEWPEPIPLDEYSYLPDFPVDALSGIGREVVTMVSDVNQVDPALTASAHLANLSLCFARKTLVDLCSHREQLNVYLCPVYDSGHRKSSTVNEIVRPIYDYERMKQEELETTVMEARNIFKIKEKRLDRLQKRAADEDDLEQRRQLIREASELTRDMAEHPVPRSPIFLVDDITPEKLGVLMAENLEKIGAIHPEGNLFEIMAGRYSKDGTANIDLFLKAHAGDPWGNHRIGRDSKTMQSPALTLCLAVQSETIEEIGKNNHFRGRGLLARFLYSRCKSRVGYRGRQTSAVPMTLKDKYRKHIFSLMELPFVESALRLSPDAQQVWDEFYGDIETEMRPEGSLYYLPDWGSKLPGAVARIAGLLHLAEHGASGLAMPISVSTVSATCVIGAYFKEHALAIFGLMREDRRFKLARQILDHIRRNKGDAFNGRDIMRSTSIAMMDEVEQGLKVLQDRGIIRESASYKEKGIGRPKGTAYQVNPRIFNSNIRKGY